MSSSLSTFPEEFDWLIAVLIYKKKISLQVHCISYTKLFLAQSAFLNYTNIDPVQNTENLQKICDGVRAFS